MPAPEILDVALPTPLRTSFDYLPDAAINPNDNWVGCRVAVQLGQRAMVGIVVGCKQQSQITSARLRSIDRRVDEVPLIPAELLQLCRWAADYYLHPLGEVLATALPAALRRGDTAAAEAQKGWQLSSAGRAITPAELTRSPRQRALLQFLQQRYREGEQQLSHAACLQPGFNSNHLKTLQEKGWIESVAMQPAAVSVKPDLRESGLPLNEDQRTALASIRFDSAQTCLLHGATGSGKTEVYLQAIARVLEQGRQALVLIPEIGLTPQMLARFRNRFACRLSVIHSGLSDGERKQAWLEAAAGHSDIIIGTRSAIFSPLPRPGIIIIDEEHDLSFKQQDGLRYSARDMAVIRARQLQIPLLLGSATPSLESLHNALQARYLLLRLPHRAGTATPPGIELVDIRRQTLTEGFSTTVLDSIAQRLANSEQVLVFINRRGFAPTLMCHDCGWLAQCPHCDARLTLHMSPMHLHCHHCDYQRPPLRSCPTCHSVHLQHLGQGTERAEALLSEHFAPVPVLRVDRDSTSRKHAMQNILEQVHGGEPCILVGTQMLAKGHHFPNVTLAVILDADSGLFSTDFRGPERMGQLLVQVAGRAGRADKSGKVLIQTHLVDHPLLQTLLRQGYSDYARRLLHERQLTGLPPFRFLALLRAESKRPDNALQLLRLARKLAQEIHPSDPHLHYLGPLPAPMERRNQRFRYQLQLNAASRAALHHLLRRLIPELERNALSRRTRWSVDIDPLDMS